MTTDQITSQVHMTRTTQTSWEDGGTLILQRDEGKKTEFYIPSQFLTEGELRRLYAAIAEALGDRPDAADREAVKG